MPPALGSSAKAGEQPRGWRALLARRLALHFVPERTLAQAIAGAGCSAVETEMAGRFFAYAGAAR